MKTDFLYSKERKMNAILALDTKKRTSGAPKTEGGRFPAKGK